MLRTVRHESTLAAAALAALIIAACTDTQSPPLTSGLTQPQAQAVGDVVASDVAALPEGMSFSGSGSGLLAQLAPPAAAGTTPACTPTRTPASPANSDGDPIPDSVHVDFAGCTSSGGSYTISISGTIDFVDPTPTTTDFGLRTRYTDFTRSVTNTATSQTRSTKENGVREVIASASGLQETETNFRTDHTFPNGTTASHVRDWSVTFTPDQGGTIQHDGLPSGTLAVSGTSTWTSASSSYSLSVNTNPPLHYNATCTVGPRFDTGTVTAQVTKNGVTTTVTVTFTACGQYTVTRS
jgi:hypothetical protein